MTQEFTDKQVTEEKLNDSNVLNLSRFLANAKAVTRHWLYLPDEHIIDVVLAAYIANRLSSDPCWVKIIGAPSNAKTEILNGFCGHDSTYFLSNLTTSTLISGREDQGDRNKDFSLLPYLTGKLLIMKDFTTVLTMRSENQAEIIGQLREIHDGHYRKRWGNGKELNWQGKIGMLTACTPAYDKHYGVISALGERFLLYRIDTGNRVKQAQQAQRVVGREIQMRAEIRAAFHEFIDQFERAGATQFENSLTVNEEINEKIVALSCVVADARCPVDRDRYNQRVLYEPSAEGPARLLKQLMLIGKGVAIANGKTQFDDSVYRVIRKIAQGQLPVQRLKVMKFLFEHSVTESSDFWLKTKNIALATRKPVNTTKLLLEDLMVIGCVNRDQEGEGEKSPYTWQLGGEFNELLEQSGFFDD